MARCPKYDKKGRFSLENGARGNGRKKEVGHMGFDDPSYEVKLTRATAQRGGHTVSDFILRTVLPAYPLLGLASFRELILQPAGRGRRRRPTILFKF
jgi:hypothetical protein